MDLVVLMQRLKVLGEGHRRLIWFRLKSADHHANQVAGLRQLLAKIQLWQGRRFNNGA